MRRNRKQRKSNEHAVSRSTVQKVADVLDITMSSLTNLPSIELCANRQAIIDGVEGVIEYDSSVIRLKLRKMTIKFIGRDLYMKSLSDENAVVEGYIAGIEFGG